jgi:glycosyltransferase involved in cell wall biosynthesis
MNVLWLSWKDRWHPQAGGAETVSGEIMDRLVKDGHSVTLLTAAYPNATGQETKNGVKIVRAGNRFTVYGKARQTYRRQYRNWPDVIIDEMNTIPFGAGFINREKSVLLCYQLAREVWFYQMFPPVSWIGYMSEPIMLKAMAKRYPLVLTESNSSKKDLASYGFKNIHVFKVGMAQKPIARLSQKKYSNIVLSLGSIRPMKRTLDAVRAFEVAKDQNPELTMVLAGGNSGKYAQKVMDYIKKSRHASSISVLGRVSNDERLKLMRKADIILVTSIKEGWGLIVTEANSQGTPAIGYDTDGLRDSIQNNKTGLLVPDGDFTTMGKQVVSLLSHHKKYEHLRTNSWKWSHEFSFNASYQDFLTIIESRLRKRTRN